MRVFCRCVSMLQLKLTGFDAVDDVVLRCKWYEDTVTLADLRGRKAEG